MTRKLVILAAFAATMTVTTAAMAETNSATILAAFSVDGGTLPQSVPQRFAATSRQACCSAWKEFCDQGCEINPGQYGVQGCKKRVCGSRYNTCVSSGVFPFRTIADRSCK